MSHERNSGYYKVRTSRTTEGLFMPQEGYKYEVLYWDGSTTQAFRQHPLSAVIDDGLRRVIMERSDAKIYMLPDGTLTADPQEYGVKTRTELSILLDFLTGYHSLRQWPDIVLSDGTGSKINLDPLSLGALTTAIRNNKQTLCSLEK